MLVFPVEQDPLLPGSSKEMKEYEMLRRYAPWHERDEQCKAAATTAVVTSPRQKGRAGNLKKLASSFPLLYDKFTLDALSTRWVIIVSNGVNSE